MKSMLFRQHGATLIVGLIMLVLITMFVVTAFKLGKSNLQTVGNAQLRNQALSAAQGAIEMAVSKDFTIAPANAITATIPCGNLANQTCVDVNGDGVMDVTVAVTLNCVAKQVIPVGALDFTNPNDAGCLVGVSQAFGVAGVSSNASLCAESLWNIQAVATDSIGNAQYAINQGTGVRVPATAICP